MKKFFSKPIVIWSLILLGIIGVVLFIRWQSNRLDDANSGMIKTNNNSTGRSVNTRIPQYVQDHTTGRFTKPDPGSALRSNSFLCDCMIRDTPNSPYHPVTILCSSKFATDCPDCCGLYEWHNSGRTKYK